MKRPPPLDWLQIGQGLLGYHFARPELLRQALTHRSHRGRNNERLEFLGDSLLQTVISSYLYRERPQLSEGELTRLRMTLVRGRTLSALAQQIGLGAYLQLGPGERKSGGRRRESILEDALEAVIAAIFLDSDFNTCERFVLQLFREQLAALPERAELLRDSKTKLQEWLQARGLPTPSYEIVREEGLSNERIYEVEARSENLTVRALASTRKEAEQQCAAALYKHYCGEES